MEREPTDDKLSRKLWLIGDFFPQDGLRNIPQNGITKRNHLCRSTRAIRHGTTFLHRFWITYKIGFIKKGGFD